MFIIRFIKRLSFRRKIKKDETSNVVTSMVKAKELYKRLAIEAHPDRNPQNREVAEELKSRISTNRYHYTALILLEKEVKEKLK